jgi:hypothetical protein
MPEVQTAIIILHWRNVVLVQRAVESVVCCDGYGLGVGCVVVENGTKLPTPVKEEFMRKGVRVVSSDENLGFAGGANWGARQVHESEPEFLLFLNSDATLEGECVKILVQAMVSNPSLGACQPLVLGEGANDSDDDGDGIEAAALQIDWKRGRVGGPASGRPSRRSTNELLPSAFCHGGAMLIRAELFWRLDGFDESLFAYEEDVEIGVRVRKHGAQCACVPAARVRHADGGSVRTVAGGAISVFNYLRTRNRIIVAFRHADARDLPGFVWNYIVRESGRAFLGEVKAGWWRRAGYRFRGMWDGITYRGCIVDRGILRRLGLVETEKPGRG